MKNIFFNTIAKNNVENQNDKISRFSFKTFLTISLEMNLCKNMSRSLVLY